MRIRDWAAVAALAIWAGSAYGLIELYYALEWPGGWLGDLLDVAVWAAMFWYFLLFPLIYRALQRYLPTVE